MRVRSSAPHLLVSDVEKSLDWFVDVLGFERADIWGAPPNFTMPRRDGFIVMLEQAPQGAVLCHGGVRRWDAYFWVVGVDAFAEEVRARGGEIVHGPEDQEAYGMREITVRSPDGHWLVFAEDIG